MNEPENSAVNSDDFARELENLRLERDGTIIFLIEEQLRLAERERSIKECGLALEIKDKYIASLENEHKKLWDVIKVKDAYIASLTSEHAKQWDLIEEKDQYIRSLQAEQARLESLIAANRDQLLAAAPQNHELQIGPEGN